MSEWQRKITGPLADTLSGVLRLFENGVTVFPVAVTVAVGITYIFGGTITAWHWWGALLTVLGWLCLGRRREPQVCRFAACGLMLLFLGAIWATTRILIPGTGVDNVAYHLPAMRLLTEGWNPVHAPTPEALRATMGVEPWEMRLWHVLFMSKAVWYFCAAAYSFTGAPLNLFFPLWPMLFLVAAGQLWRLLRHIPSGWRLLGILLLWGAAPGCSMIVDAAVFFGGVGLLCAMSRYLVGERPGWLPMVCLSFWLIVAKQTGLWCGIVFWGCFVVALAWQKRWSELPRTLAAGCVLGGLAIAVCASPYLTSWIHYGHPLYPAYSADEEKYPVYDITRDFRMANDDALAMGHLGSFCNAYISPALTQAYYGWKLNKDTFAPNRYVWWQGNNGNREASSPLSTERRLNLMLPLIAVIAFGGHRLRFFWAAALAGLFIFPTAYLGYPRYTPWIHALMPLAVCCVGAFVWDRLSGLWRWTAAVAVLLGIGPFLAKTILGTAVSIDQATAMWAFLEACPPKCLRSTIYSGELAKGYLSGKHIAGSEPIFGVPERVVLADLKLLRRQLPELRNAKVESLPLTEADDYRPFPSGEFHMEKDADMSPFSEHARIAAIQNRWHRLMSYPGFCLRTYFVTLPKLVWSRLVSGGTTSP